MAWANGSKIACVSSRIVSNEGRAMKVLVLDIGGTRVKALVTGQTEHRKFDSGSKLTPDRMVAGVKKITHDWTYDAISMGYPGVVLHNRPVAEPHNLGPGWVGFDYQGAFGCPLKIVNDAAMQALGSYRGGKMLFLGLGTGLGTAMIVEGVVEPLELGHLPYRKATYEDYVGLRGLKRYGKKKWRKRVDDVIAHLAAALEPDEVVLGGGNARLIKDPPPGCRIGDNNNAFVGGFRLWDREGGLKSPVPSERLSSHVGGPENDRDGFSDSRRSYNAHQFHGLKRGEEVPMLTIDIISDVVCPWCYVGKRRLEKALGDRPATVRWHPFELNPDMPREGVELKPYYSEKFGSWEKAQELQGRVAAAGREDGIDFQFDRVARIPNTADAHRLIHLAGERNAQDAVVEALFKAYFLDGRDLTDPNTLVDIAAEAGLDRSEIADLLAGDAALDVIRTEEEQVRRAGVSSVPLFIINNRLVLSGAQPPEYFQQAFDQLDAEAAAGASCAVDPSTGEMNC